MPTFPKRRIVTAYRLAFTVLGSYLWAWVKTGTGIATLDDEGWLALHQRNAARIVITFNRLRGIYIKLGQSLSTMTAFLPETLAQGLESLQDNVPPTPFPEIERALTDTFKRPLADIFTTFNPVALASASLGQVHEATLPTGERVAVKIQHPYIEALVHQDLKTLQKIFFLFHLAFPRYGIKTVYRECADMIRSELDFRREGKNCERLAECLRDMPACRFPTIYWEFTAQKVLTMAFMSGIKANRLEALSAQGIDQRAVATLLLHSYCRQIFESGFYHADPHPGNLLVAPGPELIYLDFGATAKISTTMREGMTRFVEGLIHKDTKMLSEALKKMGFIAKGDKEEASERIVDYFYEKITTLNLESIQDMQSLQTLTSLLEPGQFDFSLRELATTFHIPREWVLLERTLLLLMGLCAQLDPTLNPTRIVLPYVEEFVLGKDRHFNDLILQMIKEAGSSYLTLGLKLDQALKKLERGDMVFKVRLGSRIEGELRTGTRLIAMTAIFCTSLVVLYHTQGNPPLAYLQKPTQWFSGISGILALYYLFVKREK